MEKLKNNSELFELFKLISHKSAVVIAHRGACGYLPEHTLPAKSLAYAMGADFLEQDVVASRDDELIVLHDIHLDRVTNVAEVFPSRARADGRFYARDFDLAELRGLRVWERMNPDGSAVFPDRFPTRSGYFQMHSLRDEFAFVAGLNRSSNRSVGIYPEIKRPAWHREEGIDIAPLMLALLAEFGYESATDLVFLQCFDDAELRHIRGELGCQLRLIQLIADNSWGEAVTDFDAMRTEEGLARLAQTVDGIGPWLMHLYETGPSGPESTGLVERAKQAGLLVHPYTFRQDSLPDGFDDFEVLLRYAVCDLGADGVFTDFPDVARRGIEAFGPR